MAVDRKKLLAALTDRQKKYMQVMAALDLDDLVLETLKAANVVDEAETQAVLLKEVLMPKVYALGDRSYRNDLASVSIQTRVSPDRIDRTRLIAAGVDPDLIDTCTVKGGESEPFVVVRAAKVKVSLA